MPWKAGRDRPGSGEGESSAAYVKRLMSGTNAAARESGTRATPIGSSPEHPGDECPCEDCVNSR